MVEVTQADRDAAAALIECYWSGADAGMMRLAKDYRNGHSQGVFVRTFAAHRIASTTALQADNERLAAVNARLREALKPFAFIEM